MRTTSWNHGTVATANYSENDPSNAGGFLVGVLASVSGIALAGAETGGLVFYRLWLGAALEGQAKLADVTLWLYRTAGSGSANGQTVYVPVGMKIPAGIPLVHNMGLTIGDAQANIVLFWK